MKKKNIQTNQKKTVLSAHEMQIVKGGGSGAEVRPK